MSNEETLRRALETATAQLKNIHEQLGGDELAREIKVCDEALAARHEQRGAVEAERERCAKIAEYQSKIPDYTEVQRAHIYCAASIAAAIRKATPIREALAATQEPARFNGEKAIAEFEAKHPRPNWLQGDNETIREWREGDPMPEDKK